MSTTTADDLPTTRPSRRGEPPWDIALLYPLQGSWTEEDYLALNTNRLVEFSDGCIPESQRVTVLVLEGSVYREHGVFAPGDTVVSATLPGLAVSVMEVFAAGQHET